MNRFQRFGIFFTEIDSSHSRIIYLFIKFLKICPSFMPNIRFGKKPNGISRLKNSDAEVDIFTETHLRKTVQLLVDIPFNSHVETSRMKLAGFFLSSTYSSGRKKRSHGVTDCFLNRSKRFMRSIGSAESIARLFVQFFFDFRKIIFGNNAIGIQNNQIIADTFSRAEIS